MDDVIEILTARECSFSWDLFGGDIQKNAYKYHNKG